MASESSHLSAPCNYLWIRLEKPQCCRIQFCVGFALRLSFEFLWRLVSERGMQSFLVVIAVDKLLDVTVQILEVAVFVGVDFLAFERLDEALATGIVVGVCQPAHALNHPMQLENRDIFRRSVLHATVGAVHYSRQGAPQLDRTLERVSREAGGEGAIQLPAHGFARVAV